MNETLKAILLIPFSVLAFTIGKNLFSEPPKFAPIRAIDSSQSTSVQHANVIRVNTGQEPQQDRIHGMVQLYAKRFPNGQPLSSAGDIMVYMDEGPNQVIYRNEWVITPAIKNYSSAEVSDTRNLILGNFRAKTCHDKIFLPMMQNGMTVVFKSMYLGKTLMSFTFGIKDC